jgi:hypothetical protein
VCQRWILLNRPKADAIIFTFSAKPRPATGRLFAAQLPINDRDTSRHYFSNVRE